MAVLQYILLLLLPLPLFFLLKKSRHYIYCLPPLMALLGIYLYNIIGSYAAISDPGLYSDSYYFSLLSILIKTIPAGSNISKGDRRWLRFLLILTHSSLGSLWEILPMK